MTIDMLDSIRQLSYPNIETIVVDNGSKINSIPALEAQFPEIIGIRSEKNLGFSGGNNLGIDVATGEYYFFVNNDTVLADGLIEKLLSCFINIPNLGVVSPLIMYFPGEETNGKKIIQYLGTTPVNNITARNITLNAGEENTGQFADRPAFETPYAHGAAMMLPAKVVKEVAKMPEEFFLYYEELDWCEQIRRAGYKVYVEPKAEIFHRESVSTGKTSPLKTYYLNRNRIFFMRRNRSLLHRFAFSLFLIFFTIPKNVLLYLVRGQWDHLNAFWRAISWNFLRKERFLKPNQKAVNTFLVKAPY